jgi:hypothetical protein
MSSSSIVPSVPLKTDMDRPVASSSVFSATGCKPRKPSRTEATIGDQLQMAGRQGVREICLRLLASVCECSRTLADSCCYFDSALRPLAAIFLVAACAAMMSLV